MARGKKKNQQPKKKEKEKEEEKEVVAAAEDDDDDKDAPEMEPVGSDDGASSSGSDDEEEEYDSAAEQDDAGDDDDDGSNSDPEVSDGYEDDDSDDDDGFEEQGSSDDESEGRAENEDDDSDDEGVEILDELRLIDAPRSWPGKDKKADGKKRGADGGGKKGKAKANANASSVGEGGKAATAAAATTGEQQATTTDEKTTAMYMHTDDLSSDDEDDDGTSNRIGRVPLHWYDDHDHVGYDAHGDRVIKSAMSNRDLLDRVLDAADEAEAARDGEKKFTVYDALNAKEVTLTPRQVELVRRLQSGAFAHPEHDANPDYVDYFSGVDPIKSGLNSDRYEKKTRFQPSKWEKLQVRRLLHRLKSGSINMDYLEGRVRDMNDLVKRGEGQDDDDGDRPFALWRGDEEDELALRKGPRHMPAPKVPPPTHAQSYNPPEEYLPTPEELKEWEEMDPSDRPHGPHFVPKKFDNLRSVGAYEHVVTERFERCLDLYLCPRAMKRRLNIDPESLVPRLPRASDLRPFPTTRCIGYAVPGRSRKGEGPDAPPPVRCLAVSPDGQFLASGGGDDGTVRLWEVQTGRLLRSWDLTEVVVGEEKKEGGAGENESAADKAKMPVASLEWNPNRSHHVLLAAVGNCAVLISTGTGGPDDAEVTEALLAAASSCKDGGNIPPDSRAARAVAWTSLKKRRNSPEKTSLPVSAYGGRPGPIALLRTNADVASARWHRKGDYFATVSPKAGAAAVLIHQLSRAASQQPFGKVKGGEAQLAVFHPHKPFLFVATKESVRVYHLVKQAMVKRLVSGCRHISSIDVHASGDHVVIGSLDRRLAWFDLDLSSTPYKTLKYHERALRAVGFHPRYPLMASASDDGTVHVFHSMVYSDLMRNPLIVPVKVLRGHSVANGLGTLAMAWHPTQPWLFSAGADGNIHLFQDL